jgi:hypothetical protein
MPREFYAESTFSETGMDFKANLFPTDYIRLYEELLKTEMKQIFERALSKVGQENSPYPNGETLKRVIYKTSGISEILANFIMFQKKLIPKKTRNKLKPFTGEQILVDHEYYPISIEELLAEIKVPGDYKFHLFENKFPPVKTVQALIFVIVFFGRFGDQLNPTELLQDPKTLEDFKLALKIIIDNGGFPMMNGGLSASIKYSHFQCPISLDQEEMPIRIKPELNQSQNHLEIEKSLELLTKYNKMDINANWLSLKDPTGNLKSIFVRHVPTPTVLANPKIQEYGFGQENSWILELFRQVLSPAGLGSVFGTKNRWCLSTNYYQGYYCSNSLRNFT